MITLNEIVSSNLDMLKEQEASLSKSLDFVREAIKLFESQGGSGAAIAVGRGRKRGRKPGTKIAKAAKAVKAVKRTRQRDGGKHIDRIMMALKEKNAPISSGDLIESLFKQQSKDKDIKHFSTLIYPVLTKAYKNKALRLKGGKIHLA